MTEDNIKNLSFQELLDKNIEIMLRYKSDHGITFANITSTLNSKIFDDFRSENLEIIQEYNKISAEITPNINQLKNELDSTIETINKTQIHISSSLLSIEKSQIDNHLQKINAIFKMYFIASSNINIAFKNYLKTQVISNNSNLYNLVADNLKSIIDYSNQILNLSNTTITMCKAYSVNILNISEKFQFEKNKNFTRIIDEEKNIILKDFYIKIDEITQDFILKQKDLTSDFTELKVKYTNLKKEFEQITRKNDDLKVSIDKYEEEIENLSNLEFAKIRNEIEGISLDAFNKAKTNLENNNRKIETRFNQIKDSFEKNHAKMNIEFEKAKKANDSFVQLVQNAGIYKLTENYNKKAEEEKTEYQNFRKYTSRALYAAIACTVVILGLPIFEYWKANPPVDTNYFTILARLTISLMFFVLALYFSKQAAKHYECYQENHRTFLQLAALEPFMANMTLEEQKEIRKSLIPSYFNQSVDGKFAIKGNEVDMSVVYTLLDKVSNLVPGNKKPSNEASNDPGSQK